MLGLRPRLKTRPSLLDLIARHNLEAPQLPYPRPHDASLDEEVGLDHHPVRLASPAPDNPKARLRAASTPAVTAAPSNTPAMAPSRKDEEAGEDQYGAVFSVSGPVIVAENMIGCAMYELVC